MKKTILLTGATDGIGFETAKKLASEGHTLALHGRSSEKLAQAKAALSEQFPEATIDTFLADLSDLKQVLSLAEQVTSRYDVIDVVINNAGVFKVSNTTNNDGHDVRFIVNTIAPYLLTKALLSHLGTKSRVVNLSSAAQAPVSLSALKGEQTLSDSAAYAQSKLALTMWTFQLAKSLGEQGPVLIAVNPASFLGSKMVKEAYGSNGKDLSIGADILLRAAVSDEFADASGRYYDNDIGAFTQPHPDALSAHKNTQLIEAMEQLLA